MGQEGGEDLGGLSARQLGDNNSCGWLFFRRSHLAAAAPYRWEIGERGGLGPLRLRVEDCGFEIYEGMGVGVQLPRVV